MNIYQNNYAFIDGQNVHIATKTNGWLIDYKKLIKILFPSKASALTLYKRLGSEFYDYLDNFKKDINFDL
jgi:hypothetical protein